MAETEKAVKYAKYAVLAFIFAFLPSFATLLAILSPSTLTPCVWVSSTCFSSVVVFVASAMVIAALNAFNKGLDELPKDEMKKGTTVPSLGLFLSGAFLFVISLVASLASGNPNVLTIASMLSGLGSLACTLAFAVMVSRLLDRTHWRTFACAASIAALLVPVSMLFTYNVASTYGAGLKDISFALVRASEAFFALSYIVVAYVFFDIHSKILTKAIALKETSYSPYPQYSMPMGANYNDIYSYRYPVVVTAKLVESAPGKDETKIVDTKFVEEKKEEMKKEDNIDAIAAKLATLAMPVKSDNLEFVPDGQNEKKNAESEPKASSPIADKTTETIEEKKEQGSAAQITQREAPNISDKTAERKVVSRVKCLGCGNIIDVFTVERPSIVECAKCGKKGRLGEKKKN